MLWPVNYFGMELGDDLGKRPIFFSCGGLGIPMSGK